VTGHNKAPTQHHLYLFHIDQGSTTPFVFEESIGGGHAERGGSVALGIDQLEAWPGDWREHLRLAQATDCIAILEVGIASGDQAATIERLLAQRGGA